MFYYDHALLSASKFHCNVADTLALHRLMDSSKHFVPSAQHRLFSHNTWFIQVVTSLVGDTVNNTKTGGLLSTRDILFEHCKEDHNGIVPAPAQWLECIHFTVPESHRPWFNNPSRRDKELLQTLRTPEIK